MAANNSTKPLDRFLNVFTEVHAGEGICALVLSLNIFLILTAYYIIKPVREALILAGGGAEVKSYASAGQALLLLGAVPLYGMLASRFPRRKLINTVTVFFAGCLILFYLLAQIKVPLGIIFYLWVGVFNLMIPAQFWALANDLYTPAAGKRLFVIVAFGASAGAVFGSFITSKLIEPLGVYQLMLLSSILLIASLLLTNYVVTHQNHDTRDNVPQIPEEPLKKDGSFKLVFQHKYLLMIALLMLILNWVNTTGEYILSRTIVAAAENAVKSGTAGDLSVGQYIGKFYASFFGIVNAVSLTLQLFFVSRILKYLGVRIAILILPVIALGGYFFIAFFPIFSIVRWAKTAENSTDYSLQNTVRQVLFLPTTREQKYKAKQAIDTFFVRAGDVLSALIVYVGTTFLAFQTKQFALFNLGLVVVWIIIAVLIGRENVRMTQADSSK